MHPPYWDIIKFNDINGNLSGAPDLDSFLTIASIETNDEICHAIKKLDEISEKYNVKFVLSVSKDEADLPECAKAKIVISL